MNSNNLEESIETLVRNSCRRITWRRQLFFRHTDLIAAADEKKQWQKTITRFLGSDQLHFIVVLLLLLDLTCTVLELSFSQFDSTSNNQKSNTRNSWYHWVGISVLCLLSLKSVAQAFAMGRDFIRRPGYVVDVVVVILALVLESVPEARGGGMVIVASLWRSIRVIETAFEISDEAIETQIQAIKMQLGVLKDDSLSIIAALAEKDGAIEQLQEQLNKCQQGGF